MGFLATLAEEMDDEQRRFRFGAKGGEGGTAVIQTLVLRDPHEHSRVRNIPSEEAA